MKTPGRLIGVFFETCGASGGIFLGCESYRNICVIEYSGFCKV